MKLDLSRYNERIKEAAKEMVTDIKQKGGAMGIVHRPGSPSPDASLPKLKPGFKQHDGVVDVVAIKFRRSLIYTHRGAGKGRGGTQGSKWVDKYGKTKATNPKSLGKMATGGRQGKPFINEVLESPNGVDNIATIAAEELGDAIVNNMLIK